MKIHWIIIRNYRVYPVNLITRLEKWLHINGVCFVRMDFTGLSGGFRSKFTKATIHPSDANHLVTSHFILRACARWWEGWMDENSEVGEDDKPLGGTGGSI